MSPLKNRSIIPPFPTGTLNIFSDVTHKLTESDYVDVRANDNNFILNGTHRVEHIVNRYEFVLDLKLGNTPNIVINNIDVSFKNGRNTFRLLY